MTNQHRDAALIVSICLAGAIGLVTALTVFDFTIFINGGGDSCSRVVTTSSERNSEDTFLTTEAVGSDSPTTEPALQSGRSTVAAVDFKFDVTGTGVGYIYADEAGAVFSTPLEAHKKKKAEDKLFAAIRAIEGDDGDIGPAGERGSYRITWRYWKDATEYGRVDWNYESLVYSSEHCEQIMRWYWQRYGAMKDEQKARMHNSGPDMDNTDEYWDKVKEQMK